MNINENTLSEITTRILAVARPERIILFGSAATDRMTRDSDIDLLIIEAEPGNSRDESRKIRRALRGLGYPFDIIVISKNWFEQSKNVIGGVAYPANKYGKTIYEAA